MFNNFLNNRSILSLLISNLIAIVFAVIEGWEIGTVMWIYWFQSVTIGIINFIEIRNLKAFSTENFKSNGRSVEPTEKTKLSVANFFALHYGFFHFIYAMFLLTLPAFLTKNEASGFVSGIFGEGKIIFWITVIMFILNQSYYYLQNKNNIKQDVNIGTLLFFPYARIVPMHLCIILFGFLSGSKRIIGFELSTRLFLVFFLLLKTLADISMQWVEMKKIRNY